MNSMSRFCTTWMIGGELAHPNCATQEFGRELDGFFASANLCGLWRVTAQVDAPVHGHRPAQLAIPRWTHLDLGNRLAAPKKVYAGADDQCRLHQHDIQLGPLELEQCWEECNLAAEGLVAQDLRGQ